MTGLYKRTRIAVVFLTASSQSRRVIGFKEDAQVFTFKIKRSLASLVSLTLVSVMIAVPIQPVRGADHAESTSVSGDPGADIGDVYAFLDPTDNSKVILAMTTEGFIVPSELLNIGHFPADVTYRFEIENTGDAKADQFIDVTFSPQVSRSAPQAATIRYRPGSLRARTFTGVTTVQSFNATSNPFTVTTNVATGIKFFAGMTDDPFYFDIVGFNRFVTSVTNGAPDATRLQRGRDSFAGYNIHTVALQIPVALLKGSGSTIGVDAVTLRDRTSFEEFRQSKAEADSGTLTQVDRMGVPAVNTVLIPFARKNEYNASTTEDDAAGRFAGDIVATLTSLGTNASNIGVLANVAVTNGDFLRLNLSTPNTSLGFGERATTAGYTGFPNGRRPGDDVVDVLLYFVTNQGLTTGDTVNSNDVPLGTSFPFFARPNQPLENPAVDNTKN